MKAYLYSKGYTSVITHSIKELLRECEKIEKEFGNFKNDARLLDMFYIPTRYPNGLGGELAPSEYYEKEDAQKCLNSAESILNNVKKFSKI
ncbi:MAG: HEPN domain-containing protein [Candidatus Methanoperedens sp.]|nr:HEPN domain-containing protein [Candidatus Methanoperedens sp.]